MKNSTATNADRGRRSSSTVAAFLIGIPLAVAILAFVLQGPGRETIAYRYLSHYVEQVEVVLFCCALGTLAVKLWAALAEKRACRSELVSLGFHPVRGLSKPEEVFGLADPPGLSR